jgi:hypothetical protein
VKPRLELLEIRRAPATDTWTGLGGGNFNWNNPANWTAGPHARRWP